MSIRALCAEGARNPHFIPAEKWWAVQGWTCDPTRVKRKIILFLNYFESAAGASR